MIVVYEAKTYTIALNCLFNWHRRQPFFKSPSDCVWLVPQRDY